MVRPDAMQGGDDLGARFWPRRRTAVLDWLANDTVDEPYIDEIFVQLCLRLDGSGLPIARAAIFLNTHHPEWLGVRINWQRGGRTAELKPYDYQVIHTEDYLRSPAAAIAEGAELVRARLGTTDAAEDPYPLFGELRRDGITDYVAWPLRFTLGKRQFITFATDRAEGFSDDDLDALRELLPVLSSAADVRLKNRMARILLNTYVGPHAGKAIMAGATTRGSGFTVETTIVVVDMRGFTAISDAWPRDDVIALLNDYFDAVSRPIEAHGGEILKFMGDGLLAIFRAETSEAELAVRGIRQEMVRLNDTFEASGRERLSYGVGVNFGDVMYGNIGSRRRLDFTVIGPAVNVASRLESLTKAVEADVLFSAAVVARSRDPARYRSVGTFPLSGVERAIEVFTFLE